MAPEVSIIIPTFNRSELLGATLDSVLAQTYIRWECIVVDDGSCDYTEELLTFYCNQDSRIKYQKRNKLPKGAAHCRNIGLDFSTGKYMIFLDSDDLLKQSCLANRLEKTKSFPSYDFFVFPMYKQNNNGELNESIIPESDDYLKDFLSNNIYWGIMCTLWSSSFIKKIKGFNVDYPRLNDPEIHIRAMLEKGAKYKVFHNSKPDSIYRYEAETKNLYEFTQLYSDSLILFITDITAKLRKLEKNNNLILLRAYLNDYWKNFSQYSTRRNNSALLRTFYKQRVYGFIDYLTMYSAYQIYLISKRISKVSWKRILDTIE